MVTSTKRVVPGKPSSSPRRFPAGFAAAVLALIVIVGAGTFLYLRHTAPTASPSAPIDAGSPTTGPAAPTAAVQPDVVQTLPKNHIYSEESNPNQDIAAALSEAKREHKRVLIDFGGNWCGDCQVLDLYFHQQPNSAMLAEKFVLVHVFVGLTGIDTNLDVAAKYGVPLKKGVPALAVLDATGKLLYSQQTGEFENMRHMDPGSVAEFLNRWKA